MIKYIHGVRMRKPLCTLLIALSGTLAFSVLQESSLFAEEQTLNDIEVTAEKETDRAILDIREVRESSAPDIGEAVSALPGINKFRKGGITNDVVLRGLQKDDINVLVDGQRIYGACPNRMDPAAFHVDFGEVDKIEVTKGPYDVRNAGSLGGTVQIKTHTPKEGFHTEGNLSVSSFGRTDDSVVGSSGSKYVDVQVGGAYHESDPYRDGHGKRFTSAYSDYYTEEYFQTMALSQNSLLNQTVTSVPQLFPHIYLGQSPSPNRYRYSERDDHAYFMRTGWTKFNVKPSEKQTISVSFTRQEADNIMYPYLFMDGNYDNITRGSITYTGKDFSQIWKELMIQAFTSYVDHYMTDEMRCSSQGTTFCEWRKERPYSMATSAQTRVSGGKAQSVFALLNGKTTFGVDYYERRWNADTITRSRHMSAMPMGGMGMGMNQNLSYRTQDSIPDVFTRNGGAYLEQQNRLTESLKLSLGLRYDVTSIVPGEDRRQLYNVYYPTVGTPYLYQYVSTSLFSTNFDQELYAPSNPLSRKYGDGSGYAKFDWKVNKATTLFLGYGYSVRSPSPQELYFAMQRMGTRAAPDYVGNPTLKNTHNSQGDAGIEYFTGNVMIQVSAFYSSLHNYVILAERSKNTWYYTPMDSNMMLLYSVVTGQDPALNNRYSRSYRNVNAVMYGGELSVMFALPANFFIGGGADLTRGINVTDNRSLPEMPPEKGFLRIRYDDNTYLVELEGVFAATQTHIDERLAETKTAGWGIANIKFGYTKKGLKFLLGVRNLFDRYYYEHLSYARGLYSSGVRIPEPGRMLFMSMQWNF